MFKSSLFNTRQLLDRKRVPVLRDARPNEAQLLGIKVGQYKVSCELEGDDSSRAQKWHVDSATHQARGALYFELQFSDDAKFPLQSAKIRLKLGVPGNQAPCPLVSAYAPKAGIKGPSVPGKAAITHTAVPQGSVNAHGAGIAFGGVGNTKTEEVEVSKSWLLQARIPFVSGVADKTEIEYQWTRGWDDDFDARGRKFKTALIIKCAYLGRFSYTLEAEAKSKGKWRSTAVPDLKSMPIVPLHNTEKSDFDGAVKVLEAETLLANREAGPLSLETLAITAATQPTSPTATSLGSSSNNILPSSVSIVANNSQASLPSAP